MTTSTESRFAIRAVVAQSIKGPAFRRSTLGQSRLKSDDDVEIRRIGQALQYF